MAWWRKLLLGILSPLFVVLLFATAFDAGFVKTATHPTIVKQLVADSGIYDSVVPSVLKQTGMINTSLGQISATDPIIQQAATAAIAPDFVRQSTEKAIDNVYQWLDGDISQPNFSIDLSGAKANFADSVARNVQQKLAGLPVCSFAQSLQIAQNGSYDAVNATCLPRGVTAASAAAEVKQALISNKDFLKNPAVGAADIKDGKGQPVFQQAGVQSIPEQYQRAKKTPIILAILTALAGLGVVFLSKSWRYGLRHIGVNLVVVGIAMLVLSWAFTHVVSKDIAPKITIDNLVLQQDLRNLVTDIARQIDDNYRLFGGIYSLLGAAAFAGGHILIKRNAKKSPLDDIRIDLAPHPHPKSS